MAESSSLLEQLAVDEAHEGLVGEADRLAHLLRLLHAEDAVAQAHRSGGRALRVAQQIHRDDDADDQVVDAADEVVHAGGDVRHEAAEPREDRIADPGEEVGVDLLELFGDKVAQVGIVGEHLLRPGADLADIERAVVDDRLDAGIQLRDDEIHQGGDRREKDQDGQQHGQALGQAGRAGLPFAGELHGQRQKDVLIQHLVQRVEQIRDHQAPDEGAEDPGKAPQNAADLGQIGQRHVEQDRTGDDAEGGHAPVQVLFIPVEYSSHGSTPFRPTQSPPFVVYQYILLLPPGSVNNKL